jgi:hypothetical protein
MARPKNLRGGAPLRSTVKATAKLTFRLTPDEKVTLTDGAADFGHPGEPGAWLRETGLALIDLPPEIRAGLNADAKAAGVSVAEVIRRKLAGSWRKPKSPS